MWAELFKGAGALNHNKGRGFFQRWAYFFMGARCPLGDKCGSKDNKKLIETLFASKDGKISKATSEQIKLIKALAETEGYSKKYDEIKAKLFKK